MDNAGEKEIRNFSKKMTFKINGIPSLSGYSFNYGNEEYLLVKKINETESREEGNYCIMKVIRGTDNQIGFKIIKENELTNAIWTRIMDAIPLDDVIEKLLKRNCPGITTELLLSEGIRFKCNIDSREDCWWEMGNN